MAQTGIVLAHGWVGVDGNRLDRLPQMGVKELVVQNPGQPWYGNLKPKWGIRDPLGTL